MANTERRGRAPLGATLGKYATGIPGFDIVADGGLPEGRVTLIAGSAGSGKTVFVSQFLAAGIQQWREPGVLVTFEDPPADMRRNMATFGWDLARWEEEGLWCFVDASPQVDEVDEFIGSYDLSALISRIRDAVRRTGGRRVALDSLDALFARFPDPRMLRGELFRLARMLKEMNVLAVFTGERTEEYGHITRHGVEEFVADNVVILRHTLSEERRRRTLEILKFRGATHQNGEFPFAITSDRGLVVIPLSAIELTQKSSTVRITTGNEELDGMCGGGFFRDSIILVSGATGTGKTLTVTQFLEGGASSGERCLLFAFEESREQLFRNALAWGVDFPAMEAAGRLRIVTTYPHARGMEDHLLEMRTRIEEFRPQRVAVDSLSALERVATVRSFRELVINLTASIKRSEITGLFTSTTPTLAGGTSVTEKHISTITDTILLLRYVEMGGEMRRALTVLKMRGSLHDRNIREFTIDQDGMHIGKRFTEVTGILRGRLAHVESERDDGGSAEGWE